MTATILLAVAAISTTQVQVQSHMTDTTVNVNATRNVRHAATAASMYVSVEGTAETASAALARVDEKIKIITDSLARFGRRIVVDNPVPFRVSVIMPQGGYPSQTARGFIAHTLVRVQVLRVEDFGLAQAAALTAGAAAITGQSFERPAGDSIWRSEVAILTTSARQTAEMLAVSQGKRLGPLITMSASGSGGNYQSSSQISLEPRNMSYGGAPEVTVNAHVSLQFRLLPAN